MYILPAFIVTSQDIVTLICPFLITAILHTVIHPLAVLTKHSDVLIAVIVSIVATGGKETGAIIIQGC